MRVVGYLQMIFFSGRPAYDRILSYFEMAKAAGGEILIGGNGQSVYTCASWGAKH